MVKAKKDKKENIYSVLALIAVIILLFFIIQFITTISSEDKTKCPYLIQGNINASFIIKYIDSPYCMWCWLEEPVLKKALAEKGSSFRLEKYDIRYCDEVVRKYGFSGTPSFVFNKDKKEFVHYGYIGKNDLYEVICELTGDC